MSCSVFWKGKWCIAQYGQWDGYPEGQGVKILNFLSVAHNIDKLKAGLAHVYEVTGEEVNLIWDECEAWNASQREQGIPWGETVDGVKKLYPSLSRDTSAGLLGIIARASLADEEGAVEDETDKEKQPKRTKRIPINLGLEFANDTLFCEWAYVIDLDKEVLEVYGGGENKHDGHRFKDVGPEDAPVPAFISSFAFSEIYLMKSNKEFLDKIKESCGKNEEDSDEREGTGEEQSGEQEGDEEESDQEEGAQGDDPVVEEAGQEWAGVQVPG
jgi:hypothetical protein